MTVTDLGTHQIRNSASGQFRGCRRRWDWSSRLGYHPLESAKPLEFGTAFHIGMETLYDPASWDETSVDEKVHNAKGAFIVACNEQRDNYLRLMGQPRLNFDETDDYDSRITLGCEMFEYYALTTMKAGKDDWFRPVKVETEFEVPLEGLTCSMSPRCGQQHGVGAPVTYAGRVDAIMEDINYGGYFLFDWKTCAQLMADESFLHLDTQIASYCWALMVGLEIDVKGFIYAEIRKATPKPLPLLSRKYKGKLLSTDKNNPTTYAIALSQMQKDDPVALEDGLYAEYLDYLQGPDAPRFGQRFEIMKTAAQLENVGRDLYHIAKDMVDPSLILYPNVNRMNCNGCAYRSPCDMRNRDENYVYTLESMFQQSGPAAEAGIRS
jgi:hypothetical protein